MCELTQTGQAEEPMSKGTRVFRYDANRGNWVDPEGNEGPVFEYERFEEQFYGRLPTLEELSGRDQFPHN